MKHQCEKPLRKKNTPRGPNIFLAESREREVVLIMCSCAGPIPIPPALSNIHIVPVMFVGISVCFQPPGQRTTSPERKANPEEAVKSQE
eukprot:779756-Pyramimonas_sp.AAC.1